MLIRKNDLLIVPISLVHFDDALRSAYLVGSDLHSGFNAPPTDWDLCSAIFQPLQRHLAASATA
jgi:hypothetical protein